MSLRNLRKAVGLKQRDIAAKLKIDRSTVSMWETGAAKPRADKIPNLAKILKCNIDEIFKCFDDAVQQ